MDGLSTRLEPLEDIRLLVWNANPTSQRTRELENSRWGFRDIIDADILLVGREDLCVLPYLTLWNFLIDLTLALRRTLSEGEGHFEEMDGTCTISIIVRDTKIYIRAPDSDTQRLFSSDLVHLSRILITAWYTALVETEKQSCVQLWSDNLKRLRGHFISVLENSDRTLEAAYAICDQMVASDD